MIELIRERIFLLGKTDGDLVTNKTTTNTTIKYSNRCLLQRPHEFNDFSHQLAPMQQKE